MTLAGRLQSDLQAYPTAAIAFSESDDLVCRHVHSASSGRCRIVAGDQRQFHNSLASAQVRHSFTGTPSSTSCSIIPVFVAGAVLLIGRPDECWLLEEAVWPVTDPARLRWRGVRHAVSGAWTMMRMFCMATPRRKVVDERRRACPATRGA